MAGYMKSKDISEVDVIYEEYAKRATEKAQRKLDRLKERAKQYKSMDVADLKEFVNKEFDEMSDEEYMDATVDEYVDHRHNYYYKSDYQYEVARKKNPEELKERYYNIIERWKDDTKRCNLDVAREQYFLFNNMTKEQEEEYYKYYYACMLDYYLEQARRDAIYKVTRDNKKKTHIMDYEELNEKTHEAVDNDITEIEKIATVGIIERVKIIDERQERRKKQIKDSMKELRSDFDQFLLIGGGGLCGAISLCIESIVPSGPLDNPLNKVYGFFRIYARLGVLLAALDVLLFKRGKNRTEPMLIEEAKKLGVYDAYLKSKESFREFSEYCEKLLEEYNIESDVSRNRRVHNGF